VSHYLNSLGFLDAPDYGLLRQLLAAVPDTWGASATVQQQHLHDGDMGLSPVRLQAMLFDADRSADAAAPGGGVEHGDSRLSVAEQAAVRNMCEGMEWVRQGGAGPGVSGLVQAVGALHPADSLAVVSAVVGQALVTTPPPACNALAALMQDLSLFAQVAARQAGARYAAWQYSAAAAAGGMQPQSVSQQQPMGIDGELLGAAGPTSGTPAHTKPPPD
jgi:hypothetical protein